MEGIEEVGYRVVAIVVVVVVDVYCLIPCFCFVLPLYVCFALQYQLEQVECIVDVFHARYCQFTFKYFVCLLLFLVASLN